MTDLMAAYMLRGFWALFLATILAVGFRRSWKAENGGLNEWKAAKGDTVVWFDPIIFPMLLAMYVVLFYWLYGASDGKQYILSVAVDIFIFVSAYFTLLLFLLPVLRRYYTAKTCATFWLIPVFLFYQPHMLFNITTAPVAVLYIPEMIMRVLLVVWSVGFIIIFSLQIISHLRFAWKLKKHSRPADNSELTEKWDSLKEEMEMYFPIELRYCSVIHTPLTVGMRKNHRITYLPEKTYQIKEAELIFSHELHHIQRNDAHTKFFLRFCNALGWPHPLVWAAIKKAEDDLELSCDEIVLKDADPDSRKKYAELLLTTAGNANGFTTCLSASARTLRYRMRATIHGRKKRLGTALLFIVMAVSVFCTGKICLATDRDTVDSILRLRADGISEAGVTSDGNIDQTAADTGQFVPVSDTDKLTEYLSGFQADRVLSKYNTLVTDEEPVLYGVVRNVAEFYIFDEYMEVNVPGQRPVLYHLTEPVDWEQICSFA